MNPSSVVRAALSEGRAAGRLRGAIEGKEEALRVERQACIESIERRHPTLLPKALPAINACQDHAVLCDWILRSAGLATSAFARVLGIERGAAIGRPRMIQSSFWQAAWDEGKAEGEREAEAEGKLAVRRELCIGLIEQHHPTLVDAARSVVEGCTDHATLREWSLQASLLDHASFARLIGVD